MNRSKFRGASLMARLAPQAEVGLYGKRIARIADGIAGVYGAAKSDLLALVSFPRQEDATWKFFFHPTTLCLAFVVAICGLLAILQLTANVVGLVRK
jgi:hypothetical protein